MPQQYECEADFEAHMKQEQESMAAEFAEEIYKEIDELKLKKDKIQGEIDSLRSQLP